MKNIHVLPTDKPSSLFYIDKNLFYLPEEKDRTNWNKELVKCQNIYITSGEEIKVGDWFIDDCESDAISILYKCLEIKSFEYIRTEFDQHDFKDCKKIILTTDQDLIKDGVQPILDEFLEWFVKNPSCKEVRVEYDKDVFPYGVETSKGYGWYNIIIPKEETKQDRTCTNNCSVVCGECQIFKPKQETLEEVAETQLYITINKIIDGGKNLPKGYSVTRGQAVDYAFKIALEVAKWQQEQNKNLYSEEEVLRIITKCKSYLSFGDEFDEIKWFEQFKKK